MLAYWYTYFSGAIPCKVCGTYGEGTDRRLIVKTTVDRGPYPREWVEHCPANDVLARPLRRIRGTYGRQAGRTLTSAEIAALPVASFNVWKRI